jgi:hypothetical protein
VEEDGVKKQRVSLHNSVLSHVLSYTLPCVVISPVVPFIHQSSPISCTHPRARPPTLVCPTITEHYARISWRDTGHKAFITRNS